MTANSTVESALPEFPDTVTVEQTVINLADDASLFKKEELTWTLVNGEYRSDLSYSPVSVHAVWLFINGVYQEYNVDYIMTGLTLIYQGTPLAGATTIAQYLSNTTGGVPAGAAGAGTIVGYSGSTAPSGWLICDGSAVSRVTYANLFLVIDEDYGVGDGATTFNLPDVTAPFYDGATLVSSTAIIKY